MATMLVQIQVKDFSAWKKGFEAGSGLRTTNGELSHQIFQDANDQNKVTVIYDWTSLENARQFAQSPELKAAMMEAGVMGPPSVSFLSKV